MSNTTLHLTTPAAVRTPRVWRSFTLRIVAVPRHQTFGHMDALLRDDAPAKYIPVYMHNNAKVPKSA